MKEHIIDLFKYNEWSNRRVLITLEEHGLQDHDLLRLYSHILSAQTIWLNRIIGIPTSPFPVWEVYNLRELRSMTEESTRNWLHYFEGHRLDTFEEMIFYKNTSGTKYENTIREIINQVISHGSYHRGQLAMLLRSKNIDPPATDYIVYAREK